MLARRATGFSVGSRLYANSVLGWEHLGGRLTHELNAGDAVHDALQADPGAPDARLSVAFARQEATEHGDQSQDLFESWPLSGRFLLVEQVGGMPFIFVEKRGCLAAFVAMSL